MSERYTEGLRDDGAVILEDGVAIPITQVLKLLNRSNEIERLRAENEGLRAELSEVRKAGNVYKMWVCEGCGVMWPAHIENCEDCIATTDKEGE